MSFAKQQVYKLVVAVALVAAFAVPVSAQELKIGVVNIPALMQRAPQTQAAMDELQEEFAPRQREILARPESMTNRIRGTVSEVSATLVARMMRRLGPGWKTRRCSADDSRANSGNTSSSGACRRISAPASRIARRKEHGDSGT